MSDKLLLLLLLLKQQLLLREQLRFFEKWRKSISLYVDFVYPHKIFHTQTSHGKLCIYILNIKKSKCVIVNLSV